MTDGFGQRASLHKRKAFYTDAIKEEICELRLTGKTCGQVAEILMKIYGFGGRDAVSKYSKHLKIRIYGNSKQGFKEHKPRPLQPNETQELLNSWPVCAG